MTPYAVLYDLHVPVFELGQLAVQLFCQGQRLGHQGVDRRPVSDRMKSVGAGDLSAKPGVTLSVQPAPWFGLPTFQRRIGVAAKPTCRSMGPRIGLAPALGSTLVALCVQPEPWPRLHDSPG